MHHSAFENNDHHLKTHPKNHLIKLGSSLNTNIIIISSSSSSSGSSIIIIIITTIRMNQVVRSTSLLPLMVTALNR